MLVYHYDLRFVDFLRGLCVFGEGKAVGGSCDPKVCELSSCPRPRSLCSGGRRADRGRAQLCADG